MKSGELKARQKLIIPLCSILFFLSALGGIAQTVNLPPPNDNLADAIELRGSADGSTHVTGSTLDATREANEPTIANGAGSIWYRWTPEISGRIRYVDSFPRVAVFLASGDTFADLSLVSRTNERPYMFQGKKYYLAVYAPAPPGWPVNFRIETALNPPANDHFANASEVQMANGSIRVNGTTFGATREPDEPLNTNGVNSVWYQWTPENTETVQFTLDGPGAALSIYRREGTSISELVQVARASESMLVTRGERYYLAVYSRIELEGPFELHVSVPPPPRYDRFEEALEFAFNGIAVTLGGLSTVGSTLEPGEPRPGGTIGSIWLKFKAPFSGRLFHTVVNDSAIGTLYSGRAAGELAKIDPPDVIAGGDYYVCFNTIGNLGGAFWVRMEIATPSDSNTGIANDHFANAIPLMSRINYLVPESWEGTREIGEPDPTIVNRDIRFAKTLWWKFEAPANGILLTHGESLCYAIYVGDSFASLRPINTGSDLEFRETTVRQGETYYFQVQPMPPLARGMKINFYDDAIIHDPPANDHFQNALRMEGAAWSVLGNQRLATSQPGEPLQQFSQERTLWYSWVMPSRGLVRVSTMFGGWPFTYRGSSLESLQEGPSPFLAEAGEVLHFQVDVRPGGGDKFSLSLHVDSLRPPNDDFAHAADLPLTNPRPVIPMHESTLEPGEPEHLAVPHKSAWWRWRTPDVGGTLSLTVIPFASLGITSTVAVYEGTGLDAGLRLLAQGQVTSVALAPNQEVYIAAAIAANAQTEIQLRPFFTPGPDTRGTQIIQFPALPDLQIGPESIPLHATSSSGLPVMFSIMSGPATLKSNLLHLTGSGVIEIKASQSGNMAFLPAQDVIRSFTARKAPQTIRFEPVDVSSEPIRLAASASSGLPVLFEIESGPAAIEDGIVITLGEGPVIVRAFQPGNLIFEPANPVTQLFIPKRLSQTIDIISIEAETSPAPSPSLAAKTLNLRAATALEESRRIEFHAEASSGLPIRLILVSGMATLAGDFVHVTGPGDVIVRAIQEGDRLFRPASKDWCFAGTSIAPKLSISASATGFILAWPSQFSNFNLETAASLNGPWDQFTSPPEISPQQISVPLDHSRTNRFFRLKNSQ